MRRRETCKAVVAIRQRLVEVGRTRDRAEIEERREGCSYEEALLLEWLEAYFRERKA